MAASTPRRWPRSPSTYRTRATACLSRSRSKTAGQARPARTPAPVRLLASASLCPQTRGSGTRGACTGAGTRMRYGPRGAGSPGAHQVKEWPVRAASGEVRPSDGSLVQIVASLVPWHVTLAPALQPRDMVAGHGTRLRPGAVLSPAGALASPVTGRCPAQPPRCDIVVVLTQCQELKAGCLAVFWGIVAGQARSQRAGRHRRAARALAGCGNAAAAAPWSASRARYVPYAAI
jgi:hypothetical protein